MQLRDDLLSPLPGDNPAGEDLRYEPVYDQIKLARTEEDDIPVGDWKRERKTADFREVIDLTQAALATRSKDLQLAAWLAEALLREGGFRGFHQGLELIRGLLADFWDHVYPELEDGDAEFRATPLEWLAGYLEIAVKSVPLTEAGHTFIDHLEAQGVGYESEDDGHERKSARAAAIEEGKLTPEEFDRAAAATSKAWYKETMAGIEACLSALESLEAEGDELFGDVAPSYRSLEQHIGEVQRIAQKYLTIKLKEDPDPVEPDPVDEVEPVASVEAGPGPGSSAATGPAAAVVLKTRADAATRIAEAAAFLRQQNPRDPAPYGLLRGFRWAEIRGVGDAPDPRLLEAPPTQVRTRLKTQLLDENWSGLLESAEEVMATPFGRGWLDLQRYVMTALSSLGSDYDPIRRLIHGALAELLRDVPSLPDATLMDDSPTANRETRSWMTSEGIYDAGVSTDAGPKPSVSVAAAGPSQLVRQARSQVRDGRASDAVALLLQASERASHPREGFLNRSEAASIMVDHGMGAVARPILDDMVALIQSHTLDGWESGETVARPLGLLYRVKKAAGEGADDLYERICRLDPVQALRLQAADSSASASSDVDAGASPDEGVPTPDDGSS